MTTPPGRPPNETLPGTHEDQGAAIVDDAAMRCHLKAGTAKQLSPRVRDIVTLGGSWWLYDAGAWIRNDDCHLHKTLDRYARTMNSGLYP